MTAHADPPLRFGLVASILIHSGSAHAEELATPPPAGSAPVEVVVRAERAPRDTSAVQLEAAQARRLAGSQGDPVKASENLPGQARVPLGSNRLVVWGSAPRDTRFFVDGVEIPELFHQSALRSTLSAELVESVTFSPGAFGASHGRGIGGTVRVTTRDVPCCTRRVVIDANTLDGSLWASDSLGERLRLTIGGRYGWLEPLVRGLSKRPPSELFPIPNYFDYQAKAELALRPEESVTVLLLGSGDDSTHRVPAADPGLGRELELSSGFERVAIRYRRRVERNADVDISAWLGRDRSDYDARFDGVPAVATQASLVEGARAEYHEQLSRAWGITLGSDVAASQTRVAREGSVTVPPREGDAFAFGEPPGGDVNSDTWRTLSVDLAPFVSVRIEAGALRVEPSLRLDGYLIETSRKTPRVGQTPSIGRSSLVVCPEPRLSASFTLSSRATLFAAAGWYSQPPAPADLSAVFGSPSLGPEKATHLSFGESAELTPRLSVSVTGFYKSLASLVVRDPNPTPALARALLQQGSGRSYGVAFLVRQRPWHGFFGWAAYTVSRSERRAAPGAALYPFDYDAPHVLTVALTKVFGGWTFGARARLASGFPRTPVVAAFFNERAARYEPVFGRLNSGRLPAFFQLDARVERSLSVGRERRLVISAELLNVTNHRNVEEMGYSLDYSKRAGISGLPLLGVLGARLEL